MHTPSPWIVTKHNNRIEIKGNDGWQLMIAHVYKSGMVNGNKYEVPAEDNADLMAAAPELLEACEDSQHAVSDLITDEFDRHEKIPQWMIDLNEQLLTVIAKAKGKK